MIVTIIRLYDHHADAANVVRRLKEAGVPERLLSDTVHTSLWFASEEAGDWQLAFGFGMVAENPAAFRVTQRAQHSSFYSLRCLSQLTGRYAEIGKHGLVKAPLSSHGIFIPRF